MTTVHQAIVAVIGELPSVGKTDSAQGVPYRFRGIETLVGHVAPLLAKHGVFFAPTTQLVSINDVVSSKDGGKPMPGWSDVILAVDWKVYGPEGDHIEARTYGIGRDNSDKGVNKAQTQAMKYLLLELFCIGDRDDDGDASAPVVSEPSRGHPLPPGVDPAAAARGRARAEAAVVPAPAPPAPEPDPEQGKLEVAYAPEVVERMGKLIAATPKLSPNQRQGRVVALVRKLGTPERLDETPAMIAHSDVWEAVCAEFGLTA